MDTQISFEELSRRGKEILDKQGPISYEKAKEQVERLKKGSYLRRMTQEEIKERLSELFYEWRDQPRRSIRLHTGPGGMDLFNEAFENERGLGRVYIGYKIPRFLRKIKSIRLLESHSKGWYRLIGMRKIVDIEEYKFTTYREKSL